MAGFGKSHLYEVLFRTMGIAPIYPDVNNKTYEEGYTGNNDVFSIISKISQPISRIPIDLVDKDGTGIEGPPLDLLHKPNPFQSQSDFIEEMVICYEVFGNAYIAGGSPDNGRNAGIPIRLDILPPTWTEKVAGDAFNPVQGYHFIISDRVIDYKPEEVLHWRTTNIDYDHHGRWMYGMSPLKPLLKTMTTSTSGYDSLVYSFQNMGAYGILSMLGESFDGKSQAEAVQKKFKEKYTGNSKRGSLVITNQDHKWTNFGLSPVDMDILSSINVAKQAMAEVYGVPTVLMAGTKDKTYANYIEGERILYIDTIIPTMDALLQRLSDWLLPKYGDTYKGCKFKADYSVIDVLSKNIAVIVDSMAKAGVFTKNEIREACDYEVIEDPLMDEVWVAIGQQPLSSVTTMPDVAVADNVLKSLGLSDYRREKGNGK